MTTAPIVQRFYNQTLIQTAGVWPIDDAGWTNQRAFCRKASDGLANDVGSASLYHPGGSILWPGKVTLVDLVPLEIVGKYVRVLLEATGGSVIDPFSLKHFNPIWWGRVTSRSWTPNGDQTGLDITYDCAGLAMVLDQMTTLHHYEKNTNSYADLTLPLVFNSVGNKRRGNRSELTTTIAGKTVYIFDRDNDEEWTARQVVEYLLALAKDSNPGGPLWTLSGQVTALDYTDKWDLSDCTILEAITRLINPRNGLGYRLEMSGAQPTIYIMSLSPVSVAAGAYTLPASSETTTLDLTTADEILDFTITDDQTATFDKVAVIGGSDVYLMSLGFEADNSGHFVKDWEDADAAARDLLDENEHAQGSVARSYRRFLLRADWDGSNYGDTWVLPATRAIELSSGTVHGDSGYTGELSAGGALVLGERFCLTKYLPVPTGYDWDTQNPLTAILDEKPMEPLAFVKLASGEWMTLAEYCDDRESVEIHIDEELAAITIGPDDVADYIKNLMDDGGTLVFTLGVKHHLPLMVSWLRPGSGPSDSLRSIIRRREKAVRKTIAQDTIFRISVGTTDVRAAETEVSSDLDDLLSALALGVTWYSVPGWQIDWSKRGEIGTDYGKPGTYYTSVEYYNGTASTDTLAVDGIVTRREWDFSDEKGLTRVSTKRIKLDIETVF